MSTSPKTTYSLQYIFIYWNNLDIIYLNIEWKKSFPIISTTHTHNTVGTIEQ